MQKAGDYLAKGCDKVASWTIDPLMKLFRKGEAAVEEGAATVEAAAEEVASAAPVA